MGFLKNHVASFCSGILCPDSSGFAKNYKVQVGLGVGTGNCRFHSPFFPQNVSKLLVRAEGYPCRSRNDHPVVPV